MKKLPSYIILAIALILFIGIAPRFLLLDKTQKTITEQLSKKLGSRVTVSKMHWVWLPLPHFFFTNTSIINEYSEFSVPRMKIYPNWRIIFNKDLLVGSIHLQKPEIRVTEKTFQTGTSSKFTFPELNVFIKNGAMEIESPENYKDIVPSDKKIYHDIDGWLKMDQQECKLALHGSSPFSRSINLQGNFNIASKKYQFFLDLQDIKLHRFMENFLEGYLVPVESTARLAGSIKGTGIQNIETNLHGTLPSVLMRYEDRETLLRPGFADFTLIKTGPMFSLNIKNLEMREPQIRLSGLIERKSSTINNDPRHQKPDEEPTWILDLKGNDLDLTAIRHKILTLWGENEIAEIVCGVVRDGTAASAAYRFSGTTADFKRLDAMIIEAKVLEASIHVPGAELDLSEAKGPILIKESILTGSNLSARMGNSYGSNGELLLDVSKYGAFKLKIDIDADLQALPPVLEELVEHDGFQNELSKFSKVSGRATGTLHLGERLDNIITRVDVENMKFKTDYTPVPETIIIDKGNLHVGPEEVTWQGVKGRIGKQEVIKTGGDVSWQTGDTLLQINEIQGQVDGEQLYKMLLQTGTLPETIKDNLSSISGKIDISQGQLQGPANQPAAWDYQLFVNTKKVSFSSPLLPESATIKDLSATLTHRDSNIQLATIEFLDQPLSLQGTLHHQELKNWNGIVEFNGPVHDNLGNWINSKGWFSNKLRPSFPCTLENMSVGFQGQEITVSGKIIHGTGGNRLPMARVDLVSTPEHLRIDELTFIASGEQGSLALDFQRRSPKSFSLSWQGFVNASTVSKLFHHNAFTQGTFAGAFFETSYSDDTPETLRFKGLLKAENLHLKESKGGGKPVVFENVLLSGTGKQLRIAALNIAVGNEKIAGLGHISTEEKGLRLNIDLISSFISKESLDDLLMGMQETKDTFTNGHTARDDGKSLQKDWDITGRIGFDFDSYSISRKGTVLFSEAEPVHYTLYDAHGELELAPGTLTKTEIFSSKLCNLDFKATFYSDDDLGQHLELATDSISPLLLENVLPCLGVNQDLLEGEFSLKANLRKESGIWHSGNIHIKSAKGRVLRLKLLSRIFKIVNITDLFVTQVGSTGKRGFPFSQMTIDSHIHADKLIFDRAIFIGEGLNLFLDGDIDMDNFNANLTLLVAPFKSFDTLVSKLPLIGQPIMNEYDSLVTIPVEIKGPLHDPRITPLHPKAVSGALFNLVKETFKLPYNILLKTPDGEKSK